MLRDRIDQNGYESSRQVVPHARYDTQLGAGNVGGRILAGFHRYQRIVAAVQHQRRQANAPQHLNPAAGRLNGEQVSRKPLRIVATVNAALHFGAKLDFALDLAADGILPVRVTINNASTRSYSLDPDDVALIQRDGTRVHPLPIDEVVERVAAAERAKSDGAPATPSDSAGNAQRLRDRLLRTRAVSANQQLSGYLYFPLGTYTKGRVTLEDQESEEAEGFVVEF